MTTDRQRNGTFAKGNPGGPGRPPRPIEQQYLSVLSAKVTLDDWAQIVEQAVTDAKAGNSQARVFLARHLLGDAGNLLQLAAREAAGRTPESEVDELASELNN